MDGPRYECSAEQQRRLAHAGPWRFQDRRHGDAARIRQAIEVDHLLAERNHKRQPQNAARDASQDDQRHVEVSKRFEAFVSAEDNSAGTENMIPDDAPLTADAIV